MIKYEFTCPKCGGHTLLEEIRHAIIRDYIEIRGQLPPTKVEGL